MEFLHNLPLFGSLANALMIIAGATVRQQFSKNRLKKSLLKIYFALQIQTKLSKIFINLNRIAAFCIFH